MNKEIKKYIEEKYGYEVLFLFILKIKKNF